MNYPLASHQVSVHFDDELQQIRNQLLSLGGLVELQLQEATSALQDHNVVKAKKVYEITKEVIFIRENIEDACSRVIMKHQPVGRELRLIMAIIKTSCEILIFTRLIKKLVAPLLKGQTDLEWAPLENLVRATAQMLHGVFDAFARLDAKDAKQWYAYDDHLDKLKKQVKSPIVAQMRQHPDDIEMLIVQLRWARLLENIGDACQNVCLHILTYAQESPR